MPMGQGRHVHPRGDVHGNAPSNILEVMSFRMSTRVSTRNYVQIPKKSGNGIFGYTPPNTVTSGPDIRISSHAVNQRFGWPAAEAF